MKSLIPVEFAEQLLDIDWTNTNSSYRTILVFIKLYVKRETTQIRPPSKQHNMTLLLVKD